MISCLFYGVKDVIVFNNMSSPCAFANIYSGTWCVVNAVMANRNIATHGQFYSGYLFFKQTDIAYQIVIYLTVGWVILI